MEEQDIDYTKIGQERIITIADLIVEIIRKLWLVIIAAVVCAVLLGGYKYVKDTRQAEVKETNEEISVKDSNLSEEEQNEVNSVLLIQDNLSQQQEYAENSILMQIDPYDESNVTLQYYFEVDDAGNTDDAENYSNNLLNSYQNYVNNGTLISDLVEKGVALDAQYIGELITCTAQSGLSADNSLDAVVLGMPLTSFDIKVIHVDEKSCRDLADKIAQCIEEYQSKLNSSVGHHKLTLVDQSYSEVVDKSLWTFKYDRANSMVTMQEKIETLKENMSADQIALINQYTEQSKNNLSNIEKESETEKDISVSVSKKYLAVGGLGGIVLACLFIIISYIMRGTINKAEDIQYLYNMRILGNLKPSGKKNIILSLWYKIIGKSQKELTLEEQEALLAANIQLTCEKSGFNRLLVSGNDKADIKFLEKALGKLHDAGIEIEFVTDLLYSADVFRKLSEFDRIVLVERVRKSQYSDIVKEIEICSEQNVQILGAIVLDS